MQLSKDAHFSPSSAEFSATWSQDFQYSVVYHRLLCFECGCVPHKWYGNPILWQHLNNLVSSAKHLNSCRMWVLSCLLENINKTKPMLMLWAILSYLSFSVWLLLNVTYLMKFTVFKFKLIFCKSTSSSFSVDIQIGSSKCLLEVVVKVSMISANDLSVTLGSFLHDFQELEGNWSNKWLWLIKNKRSCSGKLRERA